MKILFVYKYLTAGGVETVLRARIDGLNRVGIETGIWFLKYVDGGHIFDSEDQRIFIGEIPELQKHLESSNYNVIATIDTEELFLAID